MNTFSHPRLQSGASLIEVLVAIFIFSIGMLGIAALTSAAVRYQDGNVARMAIASSIADISDKIRGNVSGSNGFRNAAATGTTTFTVSTGYNYSATYSSQIEGTITFPTSPDCGTANCNLADLAAYDLAAWRQNLRSSLPGGAGLLSGSHTQGFDITVMWFDKNYVRGNDDDFTDNPEATRVCTAADAASSAAARFCCPEAADAPDGVRCYTAKVFP